jgi:glycosyltransferase involved in cell wall biosynthesis
MRFLIHSNGPNVSTGYGVQCAQLVERMREAGHDVAVSATYGQQGSVGSWRGVRVYPTGYEVNGNDVIHSHAEHFFEGDPLGGWIIPLLDVWCLTNPLLKEFNVAAWTPVDHFPVPPGVLQFFERSGAVPVAMSRFGERLLAGSGLDPVFVPLSVDTAAFKPTPYLDTANGRIAARDVFDIPADAFCVGIVAMNKGWARDRKGFNEALRAFGVFWQSHQDAILYLHCEKFGGAEGINLVELATHAGVPEHAIRWVDQYAYRLGVPAEMMAAAYTAMDVLLAPSHGEGFCVPLIEAQACGTPVIATDFSAQTELVGAGWLVMGQPEWDPAQHASYIVPYIEDVVAKLELAFEADREAMAPRAVQFASGYDTVRVFQEYWKPFLASLEPAPPRPPQPVMDKVAVIVPAMRPENMASLIYSFKATNDGSARLYIVHDDGFDTDAEFGRKIPTGKPHTTYAEKVNLGFVQTREDWVLLVGDDVEFHAGWIEEARKLSTGFDVIGTNDALPGRVRNPDVAAGRHADHFFVRRSYVDAEGACLDGPGVLAPDAYFHWHTDKEIIGLARARGVFTPCLAAVVEHLHPGYDGREDLRQSDPTYMAAVEHAEADQKTWLSRVPLIEMQRVSRAKS